MRNFYLKYPTIQTVSGQLSWSHYCELLSISDDNKRSFYEKEAINSRWSVKEMNRQMNMYLNYYNNEVNEEDDNPALGIILCADKDEITAEYALGGLNNQIFASKYTLYIPIRKN